VASAANRRRVLVLADQGISTLGNVVVAVIVARSLPPDGFGAFGVATVAYLLVAGAGRALLGEPLLSRYSHRDRATRDAAIPDLLGACLTLALTGAAGVLVVGALLPGPAGAALLGLAPVLPLMLVQDAWRYAFIVDRPAAALAVDVAWLAGVCAALPLAPAGVDAQWYVVAWGLASGFGVAVGVVIGRHQMGRPHLWRWYHTTRDMGARFFGEFVTGQAVAQIVVTGVGAISGLGVFGAVRATQVFYGPLNTLHAGIYLALVPEGAQVARSPHRLYRLMVLASAGLAAVAVAWTLVGLALPDAWGTALFGRTWADAQDLMLPMGLAMVAGSAATGGFAGVRSLGAARESLRARLQTVPPSLVLPLGGAVVGAGQGYAAGFGLGNVAAVAIWWAAFHRALGHGHVTHDDAEPVRPAPAAPAA
jgi:hypothetical protein